MPAFKSDPVKDARLQHIIGLMRRIVWVRGVTGEELAKEWGVSPSYVRGLAAEASRAVRAEVTDSDYVGAKVCTSIEEAIDGARQDASEAVLPADRQAARQVIVHAGKTWASIAGASAAQKVQLEAQSDAEADESLLTAVQIIVSTKPELAARIRAILDGGIGE